MSSKHDCPSDQVPESATRMFSFLDELSRFRKFRETKRRVRAGEPLFQLSRRELATRGLMGPFTFNLYESMLAAIPTLAILWILSLFAPVSEQLFLPFVEKNDAYKIGMGVYAKVTPFLLPIALLLLHRIAGWACLRAADSTPESRKKSRYAYLYLDGAYGLIAQTVVTFLFVANFVILPVAVEQDWLYGRKFAGVFLSVHVLLWLAIIWNGRITLLTVRLSHP